jgi:hypothetical protein
MNWLPDQARSEADQAPGNHGFPLAKKDIEERDTGVEPVLQRWERCAQPIGQSRSVENSTLAQPRWARGVAIFFR